MPSLAHEVQSIRNGVLDGMRLAGTRLYWKRVYTQSDYEQGLVDHCPYCYDEILQNVANKRCNCCYGTGFDGGYADPEYVWASILLNTAQDERHESSGISWTGDATIKLPATIWAREGDLFAEVHEVSTGGPMSLGRVWQLDGPIRRQTVQGWVSDDHMDWERRQQLERMMVSQDGPAKLLLTTDERCTPDFWGLPVDNLNQGVHQEHSEGENYYLPTTEDLYYYSDERD